ncbi:hypothetical protein QM012_005491 [Aureobasidium pullulans]|uniref:Cullin repeat-containing protein n=1 Tax=Aureobasidium pullulans TaxID=5580 RepID=A0ABR0T5U6_AURPU
MKASRTSATQDNPATTSSTSSPTSSAAVLPIINYIESEISSLYVAAETSDIDEAPPIFSPKAYLEIYTRVHEYDIATRAQDNGVADKHLHRWLDSRIRYYCTSMRKRIFDSHGNKTDVTNSSFFRTLLTTYMSCYRKFCRLATLVGNLLRSWTRHGLRREKGENTYVASVEEMHQIAWRQEVLGNYARGPSPKDGLKELKNAIAVLVEADPEEGEEDPALVKDVVKSLAVLGIKVEI